jgi:hypothetical protein
MGPEFMIALPAILSAIGGLTGEKAKQGSTYNKGQLGLIDQAVQSLKGGAPNIEQNKGYQTGMDWLQGLFNDPSFFDKFESPLQRNFQENIIPDLANRFASMGSGGALDSTAFRRQLGREGSNLSTNLGALRGNMQQQAIPQLLGYSQAPFSNYMSMLNQALQPTQNQYMPATSGFGGNIGASLFGGLSPALGNMWGQSMAGGGLPTNISPNLGA